MKHFFVQNSIYGSYVIESGIFRFVLNQSDLMKEIIKEYDNISYANSLDPDKISKVWGDLFESITAALFIDGGYIYARKFVLEFMKKCRKITPKKVTLFPTINTANPIITLMEGLQKMDEFRKSENNNNFEFKHDQNKSGVGNQVWMFLINKKVFTSGSGINKKIAKKVCAIEALKRIKNNEIGAFLIK